MLLQEKPLVTVVNIENLFTMIRQLVIVGNNELELLDEEIIFKRGSLKRVRRWFRGSHPRLGVIINGFTGLETVVEQDVIIPAQIFQIID